MALGVHAQRPRTIDTSSDKSDPAQTAAAISPAPQTVKAKYEGGVFGYNKTMEGTLSLDDTNRRLLFRNKQQKEVLFIPYLAVSATYPDTQSRRPTAATVLGSVPAPYGLNLPAWFIKKKYRYLTINYEDPDTNLSGITSFKMSNKETVASVLKAVSEKAGLTARGEVFVRKKDTDATKANP